MTTTEPTSEPQSVAEAIALRQETVGIPEFVDADTDDREIDPAEAPPVLEGEEPQAPASAPAEPAAPAEVDPYAEYGGKDEVSNAVVIARALRTERGTRLLIAQGLEALGYTPEQVTAALAGGAVAGAPGEAAPAAPASPLDSINDEDVVTGAELKTVVSAAVQQAVEQMQAAVQAGTDPVRAAFEADRGARTGALVDSVIVELLGEGGDPATVDKSIAGDVIRAAEAYIEQDNWDPIHIRTAIVRGHADVTAELNRRFEAYQAKKKAAKDGTPTPIGGGLPAGSEPAPEPKDLNEARAIAKAAGFFR